MAKRTDGPLVRALVRAIEVDWSETRPVYMVAEYAGCGDDELAAVRAQFGEATIGEVLGYDDIE